MSIAPPGSGSPPPEAAPISHKDAKAQAAAAKAYAKAQRPWYKMKRWWAAGLLLFAIISVAGSGSRISPISNTIAAAQAQLPYLFNHVIDPSCENVVSNGSPQMKNMIKTIVARRMKMRRRRMGEGLEV